MDTFRCVSITLACIIICMFLLPSSSEDGVKKSTLDAKITTQQISDTALPFLQAIIDEEYDAHFSGEEEEYYPKKTLTRGARNNNPCNLVDNGQDWFGKIGNDGRFMVFDTPEHGIRACAVMFRNYYNKHKLDTVRKIVARMAPEHENDTKKYMRQLAHILKVGVDEKINFIERMHDVLSAVIFLENGKVPGYTESLFIPYSYQSDM